MFIQNSPGTPRASIELHVSVRNLHLAAVLVRVYSHVCTWPLAAGRLQYRPGLTLRHQTIRKFATLREYVSTYNISDSSFLCKPNVVVFFPANGTQLQAASTIITGIHPYQYIAPCHQQTPVITTSKGCSLAAVRVCVGSTCSCFAESPSSPASLSSWLSTHLEPNTSCRVAIAIHLRLRLQPIALSLHG